MSFPLSRRAWAALLRLPEALPADVRELTFMAQVGGELCVRRASRCRCRR